MVRFSDPSQEYLILESPHCTGGCAVAPLEGWGDRKWELPSLVNESGSLAENCPDLQWLLAYIRNVLYYMVTSMLCLYLYLVMNINK